MQPAAAVNVLFYFRSLRRSCPAPTSASNTLLQWTLVREARYTISGHSQSRAHLNRARLLSLFSECNTLFRQSLVPDIRYRKFVPPRSPALLFTPRRSRFSRARSLATV